MPPIIDTRDKNYKSAATRYKTKILDEQLSTFEHKHQCHIMINYKFIHENDEYKRDQENILCLDARSIRGKQILINGELFPYRAQNI